MKLKKKDIVLICQAVLALVAVLLLFAPAVTRHTLGTKDFSGFQVFFGHTEKGTFGDTHYLDASVGGIITFILMIVAIALPVVIYFIKDKKIALILNCVLVVICVVAAIFLFMGTTDLMINPYGDSKASDWDYTLSAAFVIDAILLIISAAGSVVNQFVLKD